MKTKYIFLDFDDVLHTMPQYYKGQQFTHVKTLHKLINDVICHHHCTIVISSAWRNQRNLDELKSLVLQNTCFDETKVSFDTTGQEIFTDTGFSSKNNRFEEIKKYIESHNIRFGDYVVIDDLADLFFTIKKTNEKNAINPIVYLIMP